MSLTPQQQAILAKEIKIGRHAAKLATQYLHKKISRSFDIKNKGGVFEGKKIPPMLRATKVKAKVGQYALLGLDATSNRYAFIHHFGFKGKRAGTTVFYEHSRFRIDAIMRKPHILTIREKSIFIDLYRKSGALEYLSTALKETRTESFTHTFNTHVQNIINNG